MRIFVQPSEIGGSLTNIVQEAHGILRKAGITSSHVGGFINDQGVILVELADVPAALKALTKAGLRAVADSILG
jgi:hypothetical protein